VRARRGRVLVAVVGVVVDVVVHVISAVGDGLVVVDVGGEIVGRAVIVADSSVTRSPRRRVAAR